MVIDDLPIEQQGGTPYCVSCGAVRSEDELSTCALCGAYLCFKDGCTGHCECQDEMDAVLDQIDFVLAGLRAMPA